MGVFGSDYGTKDEEGVSPTEREFDRATTLGTHRLIFVKVADDDDRHPKMQALISKAQSIVKLTHHKLRTPKKYG